MKFLIYGPNYNATDRLFDDIKVLSNVEYIHHPIRNKFLRKFYNFYMETFNNKFLNYFWYLIALKSNKNIDTCYLYLGSANIKFAVDTDFVKYCKKRNPNSVHVGYYLDIHAAKKIHNDYYNKIFDDLYIFDQNEAQKLNVNYYCLPYSKLDINTKVYSSQKKSDLYFVGQAKSRYNKLIEIFEYCEKNNIKTDFYIIGVPAKDQQYKDKIHYIDFIPYEDVLKIMLNSNCGVELMVDGATSYSQRVLEAFVYGKKIISDNIYLRDAFFYDEEVIEIFQDVRDINSDFILNQREYNKKEENIFSPINFLKMIEKKYSHTK